MIHFYFLLTILVLSPLPFGSNRPWSWSLLSLLIAALTFSWCIHYVTTEKKMNIHFERIKVPFFLFMSTLLWAFIQTSSYIPEGWGHPLWQLTAQALETPIQARISLAPEQTITAIMLLLSYGLVFFISMYYCQKSENAETLFNCLAVAGFAYASYGLISHLGGLNKILWFDKWTGQESVTSTIVNRNSYATYAGLTLLCLMPKILHQFKSSAVYGLNSNYGKQRFIETVVKRTWRSIIMFFTVGTALFLTHSRGGFLSTALAILILAVILSFSRKIQGKSIVYASITIMLLVVVVFNISSEKVMERMGQISVESSERPKVYNAIITGISDNPYLGYGYGTFEKTFRFYRTKEIVGNYDKAHNTYLENIFELGIPAASALFLSIFLVAIKCLTGLWNRQRNWIYPAIGFSGSVLVAAHSAVDFSLQIPAVAVTYSAMLGAGFSQSFSSKK